MSIAEERRRIRQQEWRGGVARSHAEMEAIDLEFWLAIELSGDAVGYHGKPRATKDLDLLISGLDGNLERVASALPAFGAPTHVIEIVRTLSTNEVAHFGVPPVRVDLLRSADGIDAESAISRRSCCEREPQPSSAPGRRGSDARLRFNAWPGGAMRRSSAPVPARPPNLSHQPRHGRFARMAASGSLQLPPVTTPQGWPPSGTFFSSLELATSTIERSSDGPLAVKTCLPSAAMAMPQGRAPTASIM